MIVKATDGLGVSVSSALLLHSYKKTMSPNPSLLPESHKSLPFPLGEVPAALC